MKQLLIPSACLFIITGAMTVGVAQVTIDRADIESWVDVPITSYAWDANDNVSGSAMPDTSGLAAILAGSPADFRSIVGDLKRSLVSVMKPMSAGGVGADSFPAATHVEQIAFTRPGGGDSTIYRFSTLTDASLTHLGIASNLIDTDQNGAKDTVIARYLLHGWKDRELPVASGGMWQSTFTQHAWVKSPIGPYLVVGNNEEREYQVTGTSTLTTPVGTWPAIVLHIYEFIAYAQGGPGLDLERFSYIAENGMAVTVAFKLDNRQNRQRVGINDIAWFVPQSSSSVGVAPDGGARTIRLDQNHPNPCTSSTRIPFRLVRSGHVRLTVYDVLGREVAELVNMHMPAGGHAAEFRTGDLPGGIYTYRLQVDDDVIGRTMMLRN